MVKNTQYRVFSAYSDPSAKELGTIYQACNWYYLGNDFGSDKRYISPYTGKMISDRSFRSRSYYKKYAKELNITWDSKWTNNTSIQWNFIPDDIELKLREYSKKIQQESDIIVLPKKHKYLYILGIDKTETKKIKSKLNINSDNLFDYPKERGV